MVLPFGKTHKEELPCQRVISLKNMSGIFPHKRVSIVG
jgi:hypothetical protein